MGEKRSTNKLVRLYAYPVDTENGVVRPWGEGGSRGGGRGSGLEGVNGEKEVTLPTIRLKQNRTKSSGSRGYGQVWI